jgi:hypothetical protein
MGRERAPKAATLAAALGMLLVLGHSAPAAARAAGIVTDTCEACHGGAATGSTVSLTSDPVTFNPGDLVTFTLNVRASGIKVGGAYITTGGIGVLQALAGEGLKVNGQGLTHSAPKAAANGAVTFRFTWQAPTKPGGVDVRVAALAGNGNNAPSGDAPGAGDFMWAFGCTAQTFYLDLDRDGYGSKNLGTLLGCVNDPAPVGYAIADGDCDENNEKIHPGATEICNGKDDNCDAQIDEGSSPVTLWPDEDGDGYYKSQVGLSKLGCGNVPGYAALAGDCNDADPAVHPGATEICNLRDDDCDGDVDELVRPRCGVGWCARQSPSCNPADCLPGSPAVETCNDFDDDCDGAIDNNACQAGYVCSERACVPSAGVSGASGSAGGAPTSTGGASGSTAGGAASGNVPSAGSGEAPSDLPQEGGCALTASPRGSGRAGRFGRELALSLFGASCLGAIVFRRRKRRN